MKGFIGLVAVIGLTLTAVTGCATSDDSASTVASETEDSEVTSVAADCATIDDELEQWAQDSANRDSEDNANESADGKNAEVGPPKDYEKSEDYIDFSFGYEAPIGESSEEPLSYENVIELFKTFGRIWPQMNDPDLKSIFRELADRDGEGVLGDDPNYVAFETICGIN
jgi:hypothetical protein